MLQCPLCQQALQFAPTGVGCAAGHSFDRARQGYLHLLPVQHKASRSPGDSAPMVQARRDFLSAGHYAPVADFVARQVAELAPGSWLDLGCGEGYYTQALAQALPGSSGYGLDISKDAIRQACRRSKDVQWLVASMARIPLADASCQLITSLFSPLDWQEVVRVLAPGGSLLHLSPASNHLLELRELIYPQVRAYDDAKHLQALPNAMQAVDCQFLEFDLLLPEPQQRLDLLGMTPHGWRARPEVRQRVAQQLQQVRVAVRLDHLKKKEGSHAA